MCQNPPRDNSLVRFNYQNTPEVEAAIVMVQDIGTLIFHGEIPNKTGYCIVQDLCGKIYTCFKTKYFEELEDK